MEIPSHSLAISPRRATSRYTVPSKYAEKLQTLTIIIPCYNEASTISLILEQILEVALVDNITKEIIIVNDCSTDDSDLIIREFIMENPNANIHYITHEINKGKGEAIKSGVSSATGDYLIIQDADLEYDPMEYNLLLKPILSGNADVVYGSRFMGGNPHRVLFSWHTWGNKVLTLINNLFTNVHLTDAHTCYKVLPLQLIRQLDLKEKRFAFDSELNIKLAQLQGLRVYEVGISYYGRTFAEGKKIRFRDAVRSIYCLLKYSLFKAQSVSKTKEVRSKAIAG